MNDISTSDSIQQPDTTKSNTDIDEVRSILSKISLVDSMIVPSLSQAIKNPKADVTLLFFQLIELFSNYFEKSTLPRDYTSILFAYFTTLHHYAVDLYCPGTSHTDFEFTQLWKNFSWIFKSLQSYIFPSDYNHIIDQITQGFMPLNPQLDEKIPDERDTIQTFKSFMYSVSNLQDPRITTESFNRIYNEFKNLKKYIRKFCQRINMIQPHLFNALSLTEYILNCGNIFVHIRDIVKQIDTKLQESSILSIHLPLELNDTNILTHRRFLGASIKINQIESRMIYNKIRQNPNSIPQDYLTNIDQKFYLSTTILMHFSALYSINRDNLLLTIWKKYINYSSAFLSFVDPRAIPQLQKQSSQNQSFAQNMFNQKTGSFQKSRTSDQMIISNLTNEISLISQDSNVFSLYEEFIRLYSFIASDRSPRSIHHLSHCITILIKISNETDSEGLKISAMKTIDMIVSHLIVSKAYDDLSRFENIIKIMNDTKRRYEQQQKQLQLQLQMQQQPQSHQSQQQISSSNSTANLNSSSSTSNESNTTVTLNSKQSQSIIPHQFLISKLTIDESPYQSLIALNNHTKEVINNYSINQQRHPMEWRILTNYLNYLDLLVTISAPKANEEGNIPPEILRYHPSPDQITECLSKFFNDTVSEMLPFTVTVPPVIFSSYPLNEAKLSPSDMQRISTLLLTERRKEHDAQYIVLEFSRLNLYTAQVKAFLDKFNGSLVIDPRNKIDSCANPKLILLTTNLLKLKKEKSFYSPEESRDLSNAIFPLLLKTMYTKALPQISNEMAIYQLIKTMYVPRCTELIKQCYLTMDFFDTLFNKNPILRPQITDLKSLFMMAFSSSFDFQKYNQTKQITKIIEPIIKEIKKNESQAFEEANNYLKNFEKFIVLCKLLNSISEHSKEFKLTSIDDDPIENTTNKTDDGELNEDLEKNKEDETNEEADKENEVKLTSNQPYKIPYVSILSKVNHLSLLRQKLIEGKKFNFFVNQDSDPESETESFDDFCSSIVAEIDETLATNKFIHINNSKLDDIIKKFSKQFNIQIIIKNLISYFEEWASYLRNVNEMSSIPELIIDRNLKFIKTHLSESLNNISSAPERISNTIRVVRKRLIELQKDAKTMESFICQIMAQNYIERATNVLTLILLIKYPLSLESPQFLFSSSQTAATQSSSQQALSQLQQQIRFPNGSSSTSSIPYVYNAKSSQQQSSQQFQSFQIQQIQKIQQQQQQKPTGIQFIQNPTATLNQQGQNAQGNKFSVTVPLIVNNNPSVIYYNSASQQQQQQAISSIGIPQIIPETQNLAVLKLYEIVRYASDIPRTQSTVSLIDKCKELLGGNFPRLYSIVAAISPEKVNSLQLSELKTFKSSLMSNICKYESESKKKELLSLNEHFKRCLSLIDSQTRQKDDQINRLKETIEGYEEQIRELERKMPRDEAASPEIISALDSILEDDILTNIIGENGIIPPPSNEPNLSTTPVTITSTPSATINTRSGGPRRRGKQRGRGSNSNSQQTQENQEETNSNKSGKPEETGINPTSSLTSFSTSSSTSSLPSSSSIKLKSKSTSSLIVNSLLNQVKNAEILNKRLHRKIERLQFPSSTPPLSQSQFTAAYPLNLDTYEGCSWIASNVKESVSSRNELSKLQDERDQLFEQMIRTSASKSVPMKPELIEGLYSSIVNSFTSANSNSSLNGKVSKSTILSFIDESDKFFTYVDYDIQIMKKKLKMLKAQNRMTPTEHIAQFTSKLQSLE